MAPTPHAIPVLLNRPDGQRLTLWLPGINSFLPFDSEDIGLVRLDATGQVIARWGLSTAPLETHPDWRDWIERALTANTRIEWESGIILAAPLPDHGALLAHIRTTTAEPRHVRTIQILKRVGKALSMHQTLQPLALAGTHALHNAAELAAVLLWARETEDGPLRLVANVGAAKQSLNPFEILSLNQDPSCLAEQAAQSGKPARLRHVEDSRMGDLERQACYIPAGGALALPLQASHRLLGVLEVVGREDDSEFESNQEVFVAVAEQLALALNTANLFESMERLASHDPLTGIANHRTMQEVLQARIREAERSNSTVGVVMLDVDHFRQFNEEEGHDAGDEVLKLVAKALRDSIRSIDLAARYGGEEFTLILPGVDRRSLRALCERVRTNIAELRFKSSDGTERKITASLGASQFPDTARLPGHLLKAADLALYEAKRGGRNRTVLFDKLFEEKNVNRRADLAGLESDLTPLQREAANRSLDNALPALGRIRAHLALSPQQYAVLQQAALLAPLLLGEEPVPQEQLPRDLQTAAALIERARTVRANQPKLEKAVGAWLRASGWIDDASGRFDSNLLDIAAGRPEAA